MTRMILALLFASASAANAMELTSPDLKPNGGIAAEQVYTACGGRNLSPTLAWSGVPKEAKSLALTLVDTSVKPSGWSHWLVIDMSPDTKSLVKGLKALPKGAKVLVSDFGDAAYAGPCPPKGSGAHHYEFTLWALKTPKLETFDEGGRKKAVWFASDIIATAKLAGDYGPR